MNNREPVAGINGQVIFFVLNFVLVLSVQKVLSGFGRATRRWPMYFPIRRSLPAPPEPVNTFWTASTTIELTC